LRTITNATPVISFDGPGDETGTRGTWGDFVRANRDSFEAYQLNDCAAALAATGIYYGDEGAGGRWSIALADVFA
jgi:hypothetical protein